MTIRVLLADDHDIVRHGLRALLEKESDMGVVGEASDGREAVELATKLRPNVVVMDISMAELNGIDATRKVTEECSNTHVIALSMHSDVRFVSRMLDAGARGYLLKDCAFEELVQAIRDVCNNKMFLSPGITGVVVEDYRRRLHSEDTTVAAPALTPREREVLQQLAEGKSTKEMAHAFSVSIKTIETHRQNIMNKLDLRSVAELTKYAIREGLTSLED